MEWVILSLFSALFFSFHDILLKRKKLDYSEVMFNQYVVMFVVTLLMSSSLSIFIGYKLLFLLILKAIFMFTSLYLYFKMVQDYEVSLVAPLLNLSPIPLILLSVMFLGEKLSFLQCLGIIVCLSSVFLLEVIIHHHKHNKPHLYHFKKVLKNLDYLFIFKVFTILMSFSLATFLDKIILKEIDVYTNLIFVSFFIIIALIVLYTFQGKKEVLKKSLKNYYLTFVSLIFLFSYIFILKAVAIPTAYISLITPVKRTSTLFTSLIGGILFHEKHLKAKIILVIMMLFGVMLMVI